MTRGTLPPPQAYTRDQLTAAYAWLQNQPEPVRKLADTSDALVAMFLRAKRGGDIFTDAPISEKNFKDSLKTLRVELDQFSDPSQEFVEHPIPAIVLDPPRPPEEPRTFQPISQTNTKAQINSQIRTQTTHWTDELDPRSRDMLQKVQARFNLSSEVEALRMLIVLGFEKAQTIFSKEF